MCMSFLFLLRDVIYSFKCKKACSLQSLELNCKICFSSDIVISLSKLQSLKLHSVYFRCVEEFSKLLAGCPVLKYLSMDMDPNYVDKYFADDQIETIHIRVLRSIFSCEGLQSLELDYNVCISTETVIPLPKLESLKLVSVYFKYEEAFCKLIAGCPMLKYLYIDTDIGDHHDRVIVNVFRYIVSSDSLRHLELYVHDYDEPPDSDEDSDEEGTSLCNVELAAPSLVYIKLEGQIYSIFIRESPSSLVEADIKLVALQSRHKNDYCNLFVEAFRAFHCAETMTLSSHVSWALSRATVNLKTRFKRLLKLEVTIGPFCWSSLQDLIEFSDNLEVLTINKQHYCENKKDCHNGSNWKDPNQVPSCLSNSLKTFSFNNYNFDGSDDQLSMVGYLLKHGNALKAVQIAITQSPIDLNKKYKLVQQICKLPMKSTLCEVEFS